MQTLTNYDSNLRDNVVDEIAYDAAVTMNDIVVITSNGVVTLDGIADSYGTRIAAGNAAWRVYGVRDVINNIVVDPDLLGQPSDEQIAIDIRQRLSKDFLVPKGRVSVSVDDGIATLKGTVNLHIQREAAREEAEDTIGVRLVANLIEIDRSAASPTGIDADIHKALKRNAQTDAKSIQVTADGGVVTLSGTARSFAERQEAEDATWRAKGVTEVKNNVVIEPV